MGSEVAVSLGMVWSTIPVLRLIRSCFETLPFCFGSGNDCDAGCGGRRPTRMVAFFSTAQSLAKRSPPWTLEMKRSPWPGNKVPDSCHPRRRSLVPPRRIRSLKALGLPTWSTNAHSRIKARQEAPVSFLTRIASPFEASTTNLLKQSYPALSQCHLPSSLPRS
jgi:hypothetical protein